MVKVIGEIKPETKEFLDELNEILELNMKWDTEIMFNKPENTCSITLDGNKHTFDTKSVSMKEFEYLVMKFAMWANFKELNELQEFVDGEREEMPEWVDRYKDKDIPNWCGYGE